MTLFIQINGSVNIGVHIFLNAFVPFLYLTGLIHGCKFARLVTLQISHCTETQIIFRQIVANCMMRMPRFMKICRWFESYWKKQAYRRKDTLQHHNVGNLDSVGWSMQFKCLLRNVVCSFAFLFINYRSNGSCILYSVIIILCDESFPRTSVSSDSASCKVGVVLARYESKLNFTQ
jgi:hypothetical protein